MQKVRQRLNVGWLRVVLFVLLSNSSNLLRTFSASSTFLANAVLETALILVFSSIVFYVCEGLLKRVTPE